MHDQFCLLVTRNLTGYVDSFTLRVSNTSCPAVTGSLHGPTISARYNMLICLCHFEKLIDP